MELKRSQKTEIGLLPGDWSVKALGDILQEGRLGGNYPNAQDGAGPPLIKMGNVGRGKFDVSRVERIRSGVAPAREDRLRHGDLLFNTRNTLGLVGKVALWRDDLPEAYYNSNLMRLRFDSSQIATTTFANAVFNSDPIIAKLREIAIGTTSVAAIYTRDLRRLPFLVPPLSEQRAIAEVLTDAEDLVAALDALVAKKRAVKEAVMQRLLTGRQRLPGFEGEWKTKRLSDVASMGSGGTPSSSVQDYYDGGIP